MNDWKSILRTNLRSIDALLNFLHLDLDYKKNLSLSSSFALNLPLRLAKKISKNNLSSDPIFRQFVPLKEEEASIEGYVKDPVKDCDAVKEKKLLQKYQGRALLLTSSACAMHCRYCFRQNFPYESDYGFDASLEYLKKDSSIHEIILSGGDPLSLSNARLGNLIYELENIPHIQRLRFHSRFLIGIPERLDTGLQKILKNCKLQIFFVFHINHPKELDEDVLISIERLKGLKIPILNQSVLLKGVNDQLSILEKLHEDLINVGIIPYYLHQLDPVLKTAHFNVPIEKGKDLVQKLQKSLSGYAIPKYVQEIPNRESKTLLHMI